MTDSIPFALPEHAPTLSPLAALRPLPEDTVIDPTTSPEAATFDPVDEDPDPLLCGDTVLEMILDGDLDHMDDDDDDVTTVANNNASKCIRLTLMVPGDKEATNQALAFVNACNESLGVIISKVGQVQIIPWKCTELLSSTKRWNAIPKDLALAETVLQGFNRFQNGTKGFFRVQISYPATVSHGTLVEACRTVNVPNQRFVQPAASPALDPITLGMLSMTVPSMEKNDTFNKLLCHIFDISILGTRWATQNVPGSSKIPESIPWKAKRILLIEVDRNEAETKDLPTAFADFFNVPVTPGNGPLLGMSANFTYLPPGWQASSKIKSAVKRNILAHASFNLGIQETTLCGVRLLNKLPSGQTLLRALLQIPSLTPMTNKDGKIISGRVFIGFVPTEDPEIWTAYYPTIFESEAESVAAALPQFIEQQWNIQAKSFCRTAFIASSLSDGAYDHSSRTFTTKEEQEESARLQSAGIVLILPSSLTAAPTDKFISAEHQRAFAADADDADTVDTDLRNKTPVAMNRAVTRSATTPASTTPTDDVSAMTGASGSTRSSKANAYASEAVKDVTRQYTAQFAKMQEEINRLLATQSQSVTPEGNERSVHAAIVLETDSPTSRHTSVVHSPTRRAQVQGPRDAEMEHSDEDTGEAKDTSDSEDNHSDSSTHTPGSNRGKVKARYLTKDADDKMDSDEESKAGNNPSDFENEMSDVSDIGSDYGSIENEDVDKAASPVIELSGDSSSDAASSYMPTPPRRKGRFASSKFSPRVDENTRPHSLRHTNSVTGSEGLGVGDSD